MDISIISRKAIREHVARIAIETGGGVEAAVAEYARTAHLTPECVVEIMEFVEEQTS